jgi:hypothetical protein
MRNIKLIFIVYVLMLFFKSMFKGKYTLAVA